MVLGHSICNTREDLIWIFQSFLPPVIISNPFIHVGDSVEFMEVRHHLFEGRVRKLRS